MAKKPLLSLPINASSFQICKELYKSLNVEGGQDDYRFWMNAQNKFFSAA